MILCPIPSEVKLSFMCKGIVISLRAMQFLKASFPIDFTEEGIIILGRDEQSLKDDIPIEVTEDDIDT